MVNLLLANPEAQTLVFARTRLDVGRIADDLSEAGFRVTSLSGEMEQAARNRALSSFKRGDLQVLVATDVAARGIDVQDIARVIHVDPPTDPDSYTHRSGRTGRAGRRGTSSLLVSPSGVRQAERVLRRAGVSFRYEPIPTKESIERAMDERIVRELTEGEIEVDAHTRELAERLVSAADPVIVVSRLLRETRRGTGTTPRDVRPLPPPGKGSHERPKRDRPERERPDTPRGPRLPQEGYVAFRVSWGERDGADPRRLMAMACRRGGIRGNEIGSIFVEPKHSIVNVAQRVAESFARAAAKPDPRDTRVVIERADAAPHGGPRPHARPTSPGNRAAPHGPPRHHAAVRHDAKRGLPPRAKRR
jgi:ATP-dependent RNA helicase DeaD